MALSNTEREELEHAYLRELEEEHERRLEKLDERKRRSSSRKEQTRNLEAAELREEIQARFYRERGYKLYTDGTGRKIWLPPEEYAWRTRSRPSKHRRNRMRKEWGSSKGSLKMWVFWFGMVVIAVGFGILLAR